MIIDLDKRLGISEIRYKALFSYGNTYSIFRNLSGRYSENSTDFECVYHTEHNRHYSGDVLMDLLYSVRSEHFTRLKSKDIIGIYANGVFSLFSYRGLNKLDPNNLDKLFFAMDTSFFSKEKHKIIESLHAMNMVLDVLNGRTISVDEYESGSDYSFFAIEKEPFLDYSFNIAEYSLYGLHKNEIFKVNPNEKTFHSLKNALFYYQRIFNYGDSSTLLYNRKELEMIKDYVDIRSELAYEA